MTASEAQLVLQLRAPRRRFCPEVHCSVPCGLGVGVECTCPACDGCALCIPLRRARRQAARSLTASSAPTVPPQTRSLFTNRSFTTNEGIRMSKLYRQGDVLIEQVATIPTGLQAVPREDGRIILAHGEVTGHAHAVVGDAEFLAADLAELEERFLRVESDAAVVHEEHDTIALPPGNYRVVRQREYAPEEIRTVAD